MKSIQKNRKLSRKKVILALAVLLTLAAIGTSIAALNELGPFADPQSRANLNQDTSPDSSTDQPVEKVDSRTNPEGKTPINNQPTDSQPSEGTVTATITAANQNESTLQIRTLIEAITTEGQCTLTLTKGDDVITQTVAIHALPNASTCKGFDTPTSDLSPGDWSAIIDIELPDRKAHLVKVITIT